MSATHSTVINQPRTLPACFSSSQTSKALVSKSQVESTLPKEVLIKKENQLSTSQDYFSSRNSNLVKAENIPVSVQGDNPDSNIVCIKTEVKEEPEPLDIYNNDVDSTSGSKLAIDELILSDEKISFMQLPLSNAGPANVDSTDDNPTSSLPSSDNFTASNGNSDKRLVCQYGSMCYRRNPQHKIEFSHPGDDDYKDEEAQCTSSTDAIGNKPPCLYGTRCYRKNKEHLERFSHSVSSSGRPKRTTKIQMEIRCDSDDSEHLEDFSDSDEYEASFIDDDESSDDIDLEEDVLSELSGYSNTSDDDKENKKRKKKALKKNKKKKNSAF